MIDDETLDAMVSGLIGDESSIKDLLGEITQKSVLYEPLRDLRSELSENNSETAKEQISVLDSIIKIYESEDYSEENGQTQEQLAALLQELQDLGPLPFDDGKEQCRMM